MSNHALLHQKESATVKILLTVFLLICASFCNTAFAQGAKLFSYQNSSQPRALSTKENDRLISIKSQKSTATVSLVKIDAAALNNNILQLPLPDGKVAILINTLRETPLPGVTTWAGRSSDRVSSGVFSLGSNGIISGSFNYQTERYSLENIGNDSYALVKVDGSKIGPAHEPDTTSSQPSPAVEKKSLALPSSSSAATEGRASISAASGASPITIDLLIAYTPNARSTMADPPTVVGTAITALNQALADSVDRASVRVRAVDFFEIPLADQGVSMPNMVRVFSSSDLVESRRISSGADVMMLITGSVGGICGQVLEIGPDAYTAYAAVNAICVMHSTAFQHEFAHLLGAHHEFKADPSGVSYAHGFLLANAFGTSKCYQTIVTTPQTNCLTGAINYYSNPRVNIYLEGHPEIPPIKIGDNTADNATIIAQNAATVSAFNTTRGSGLSPGGKTKAAATSNMVFQMLRPKQ